MKTRLFIALDKQRVLAGQSFRYGPVCLVIPHVLVSCRIRQEMGHEQDGVLVGNGSDAPAVTL